MLVTPFSKMKKRIIPILSIILVIAFIVISYTSYKVAYNSLSNQLSRNTLPLTGDNIYSEIQQDLLRPIFVSSLMAQDTFVRNWILKGENNEQQLIDYLQEIQVTYGAETSFFVSELSRRYYHSSGVLKKVDAEDQQDSWYFNARSLAASEDYEINIDTDTADTSRTVVYVNYKVKDFNDNLIGIIGIGLAVDRVGKLIEKYQNKYNRIIYFTDKTGLVTLNGSGYNGAERLQDSLYLKQHAEKILNSPNASLLYDNEHSKVYLDSRFVPEFKWFLIVEQTGLEGQKELEQTLWGNLTLGLLVTIALMFLANRILGNYQSKLEQLATTDFLTNTATRQVLDSHFANIATQKTVPMSLILLDIDNFKQINDAYGHNAGDRIIKMVSNNLLMGREAGDLVCRWGGEEFILLLPHTTLLQATNIAEKLRIKIAKTKVRIDKQDISVSASFGVAERLKNESKLQLIHRADLSLSQAKTTGKNKVISQ